MGNRNWDLLCELRAGWWAPGGGAEPFARLGEHACPAGGAFLPRKVAKEFLRDKIVIAFGVAESFAKT